MTKPKPKRSAKGKGRFSARKKAEAVRRLVAGEDLDVLARELEITAATLASWRDKYHEAGEAALKSRQRDEPNHDPGCRAKRPHRGMLRPPSKTGLQSKQGAWLTG